MARDKGNGGERQEAFEIDRRKVLAGLATGLGPPLAPGVVAAEPADGAVSLAKVAKAHGGGVWRDPSYAALSNGAEPRSSADAARGAYGTWPQTGRQWVVYEWEQLVSTDSVDVCWWQDGQGLALPTSTQLSFWNGTALVRVRGGEVAGNRCNRISFDRSTIESMCIGRLAADRQSQLCADEAHQLSDPEVSGALRRRICAGQRDCAWRATGGRAETAKEAGPQSLVNDLRPEGASLTWGR